MHIKSLNNKHGKYSATFSRIFSGDKITCIGKLWKYNVCVFMNNFKCKSLSYFRVAFIFIESIKKFLIQLFNFQNVKNDILYIKTNISIHISFITIVFSRFSLVYNWRSANYHCLWIRLSGRMHQLKQW